MNKEEIQNKLSAIAQGKLSPWDFHAWFEDNSWNMDKDSSESLLDLVGEIKMLFEEYYQGGMDEQKLIEDLVSIPVVFVRPVGGATRVELAPYLQVFTTGASHPEQACA